MDGGESVVGELAGVVGVDESLGSLGQRPGVCVRGGGVWSPSDI